MSFGALLDTLFNDPNLGVDIVYRPVAGLPIACRASFAQPDITVQLESSQARDRSRILIVKASDIPEPSQKDAVEVPAGGDAFRIVQFSSGDPMRLTWRLELAVP